MRTLLSIAAALALCAGPAHAHGYATGGVRAVSFSQTSYVQAAAFVPHYHQQAAVVGNCAPAYAYQQPVQAVYQYQQSYPIPVTMGLSVVNPAPVLPPVQAAQLPYYPPQAAQLPAYEAQPPCVQEAAQLQCQVVCAPQAVQVQAVQVQAVQAVPAYTPSYVQATPLVSYATPLLYSRQSFVAAPQHVYAQAFAQRSYAPAAIVRSQAVLVQQKQAFVQQNAVIQRQAVVVQKQAFVQQNAAVVQRQAFVRQQNFSGGFSQSQAANNLASAQAQGGNVSASLVTRKGAAVSASAPNNVRIRETLFGGVRVRAR